MKKEYNFSKGKRGALDPIPPGKTRITIRLDSDILDWFEDTVMTPPPAPPHVRRCSAQ